ncbi:MAG: hypothetical protein DRH17_05320 [Deltaproteobacteria bacterium]|nr:MAG: hypothetical protein DRH17_05320 [Deltaproteobacteria bacterium]
MIMKNDGGFTIIELVMVITTIGILAFIAISKYPTTEISLEAAADLIKSDIRSVQALAMAKHAGQSLTFDSSTQYSFPKLGGGTETRDFNNIFRGEISLSAYPTAITFNSLGEPTADQDSSITVSNGSSRTLTVLQYTGKVE